MEPLPLSLEDHMLVHLMEECAEVQQLVGKILRFGIDEKSSRTGLINRDRLQEEIADIYGVVTVLIEKGLFSQPSKEQIEAKKAKMLKYQEYSINVGKLK